MLLLIMLGIVAVDLIIILISTTVSSIRTVGAIVEDEEHPIMIDVRQCMQVMLPTIVICIG